MKKCAFLLPYIGAFKSYFQIFLDTFSLCEEYQMIIFTDNDMSKYTVPKNVQIVKMTFQEIKQKIEKNIGFEIKLNTPYKLCDYKPVYGTAFQEYIEDFKYWGHCDCDLLFGNLSMLDNILTEEYDKIFASGHMTIYKNEFFNNEIYKCELNGKFPYKEAYVDDEIYGFDEDFFTDNIHSIFLKENKKVFDKDLSYNVSTAYYNFRRTQYNPEIRFWKLDNEFANLYWDDGKIISVNRKKQKKEYLYLHLQGRNFEIEYLNNYNCIKVMPDKIMCCKNNDMMRKFKLKFNLKCIKLFIKRIVSKRRKFNAKEISNRFDARCR